MGSCLVGLAAGGAFTHVLEIPGKRRLPPDIVVAVQQQLYVGYRLPGAVIESGVFLATLVALILVWGDGPRFWLTLAAFVALAANVSVSLLWTDRENRRIATWRVSGMPNGWQRTRERWEASLGTRAMRSLLCVGLLAGALLVS